MKFLLLLAVLLCIILYKLIKIMLSIHRQNRLLKNVPGPPIDTVILGHTQEMFASHAELPNVIRMRQTEYGGLYKLWLFIKPFIIISRANYAEVFFTSSDIAVKAELYEFLHAWLGLGLLTSQGQLWRQRRKLITPAFHFAILNDFSDVIIDNSLKAIHKLKELKGTSVDVFQVMHLVALDNICETAMGIKIDALDNPKLDYIRAINDATHAVMDRMVKPWYWIDFIYYLLPAGRQFKNDLDIIFGLTNKVLKNKQEARVLKATHNNESGEQDTHASEEKNRLAFLDLLLEACDSESIHLSDKDLMDEVNTFMFEGHDTTAVSLSFTLYLLGLYPDVQEKCYQEIESIFHGSDRRPNSDDLLKMKYLERVIKESLRLFPSVPLLSRQTTQDTMIGNHTIPGGSILTLDIFHLHRDPNFFPDPETFDPERFTSENVAYRHPFAYVPFAAGARNCIGQKFAMMEEKIVLSYVLRNFILESMAGREEIEPVFDLILRSERSLHVEFTPRNIPLTNFKIPVG